MKDNEIAQTVDALRDIAATFGKTEQLRDRIGAYIVPILRRLSRPAETPAPAARPNAFADAARTAAIMALVDSLTGAATVMAHSGTQHAQATMMLARSVVQDAVAALVADAPPESVPVAPFEPYRARKVGGSYEADGTVIAEFKTIAGLDRVVFEFADLPGMLHIFTPQQVEKR